MANETQMRTEINCVTGEVKDVPLTAEEIEIREQARLAKIEENARIQAEMEAKAEAKASAEAKLAALGLTAEEIAAL